VQEYEKTGFMLIIIGALIALGKVLASNETLTIRLLIGRTFLGAGTSLVAGALTLYFVDPSPLALIGIASGLGIAGSSVIEAWVKKKIGVDQ
jgi:hypothetical protein